MSNKSNKRQNPARRRRRVDPELTVHYHSLYKSWTDVVMMFFICLVTVFASSLLVFFVYTLLIIPYEELNLLCWTQKLYNFVVIAFIKFIKILSAIAM